MDHIVCGVLYVGLSACSSGTIVDGRDPMQADVEAWCLGGEGDSFVLRMYCNDELPLVGPPKIRHYVMVGPGAMVDGKEDAWRVVHLSPEEVAIVARILGESGRFVSVAKLNNLGSLRAPASRYCDVKVQCGDMAFRSIEFFDRSFQSLLKELQAELDVLGAEDRSAEMDRVLAELISMTEDEIEQNHY